MNNCWQRGDTVVVRYAGGRFAEVNPRHHGTVFVSPHVVVQDQDDGIALYQPEGTALLIWDLATQHVRETLTTRMEFLRLLFPEQPYAVALAFDTGSGVPPWYAPYFAGADRFRGWKVDIQTPFRRTAYGFDSTDEVLDLMVRPDRSWQWKDGEQLAHLTALGLYTEADGERIRQAGRDVLPLIAAGESPFDDRWTAWRPTPDLAIRDLPDGWQQVGSETG